MKIILSGLILLHVVLTISPVSAQEVKVAPTEPTIGLALGSGGAGGLAHIALLQVFDDLKRRPDRIAGTSIGAVIGALYAAGLSAAEIQNIFDEFGGSSLDALTRLVQAESDLDLEDVLVVDIGNGGLFDSSGFIKFLAGKIEARTFADLEIPLEIVATDYWTGEMVILNRGDLFRAIEASMAVPGLFSPVSHDNQLLIDGGTSNPLPFDLLTGRTDLVVAIDVSGPRSQRKEQQTDWADLFFGTFEIMQQSIITTKMQEQKPDIYIKPETHNIRLLHFNRIKTILEQAEAAAVRLRRELLELAVQPEKTSSE